MDITHDLPAQHWLSLPDHKAFEVFAGSATSVRNLYRRLVQRWHPDRNPDPQAAAVLIRIQHLYRLAAGKSVSHPIDTDLLSVQLSSSDGRAFRYQGLAVEDFELGRYLRAEKTFAYQVQVSHKLLFDRFVSRVDSLTYANEKMKQSLSPLLPHLLGKPWGTDGGLLVIRRPRGFVRLRDLLNYHQLRHPGQGIPPVHVAWVISGLLNLACYLGHQKMTHNAISLDSVWIGPEKHDVALLGGWFFAQATGELLEVLPASSVAVASSRFLANKTATPGFDLDLIRATGRHLLGDHTGTRLISMGHPAPMVNFLLGSSTGNAVEEYRTWKQVLTASFGPPTFVPMNISSKEIYKENDNG